MLFNFDGFSDNLKFRSPYYSSELPFCVLWSQKSACTTVFKWYLSLLGDLSDAVVYSGGTGAVIHKYEMEVFKKPESRYLSELNDFLDKGGKVYSFLRDPFSRAFSSYLQIHNPQFKKMQEGGVYNSGMNTRIKIIKSLYGEQERDVCKTFSFIEYLRWLRDSPEENNDPHHKPQYRNMFKYKNIEFFAIEKIPSVFFEIEREHDLLPKEEVCFSSSHHVKKQASNKEGVFDFITSRQPVDISLKSKIPVVEKDNLLGTEAHTIIEEVFSDDLRYYRSCAF